MLVGGAVLTRALLIHCWVYSYPSFQQSIFIGCYLGYHPCLLPGLSIIMSHMTLLVAVFGQFHSGFKQCGVISHSRFKFVLSYLSHVSYTSCIIAALAMKTKYNTYSSI